MPSFTPQPGAASIVAVGGTPVIAVLAVASGIGGGFITNPLLASDQGIVTAEPLYISPVGAATLNSNGTTVALQPGQTWYIPAGQGSATSVNAATSGHKFTVVWWLPPS
jgi:hypothetical protein